MGFEYFYGFVGGDASQWQPNLFRNTTAIYPFQGSPGWNLTIDGLPAPIYRTNRLMRGAAVTAGRHTLVYTYDPASFRVGAALSLAGLVALVALIPWARAARSAMAASDRV